MAAETKKIETESSSTNYKIIAEGKKLEAEAKEILANTETVTAKLYENIINQMQVQFRLREQSLTEEIEKLRESFRKKEEYFLDKLNQEELNCAKKMAGMQSQINDLIKNQKQP